MNNFSLSDNIYLKVKAQFEKHFPILKNQNIVVAVSGGVDSMVLFHLLRRLSLEIDLNLFVITVNHNIREKNESLEDVLLVKRYAEKYGIPFCVKEYEQGFITKQESIRKKGIEEAARFYRYSAILEYSKVVNADCICFAHNKNDQLETILQYFFQGSILNGGIPKKRDKIFRPLLEISRKEIEEYASENQIEYHTDYTNLENNYLRNKIRNQLVPQLNNLFPGWDSGVLSGNEKILNLSGLVETEIEKYNWTKCQNYLKFEKKQFLEMNKYLKIKLLYKGISCFYKKYNKEDDFKRFPYSLLEKFVENLCTVNSGNIEISCKNENIFIKNMKNGYENICFYNIINDVGFYDFSFGKVEILENSPGKFCAKILETDFISGEFLLPVVIRSKEDSDVIEDKIKNKKNVSKIFSEWKVDTQIKNRIPVFFDNQLRGIWGEPFGYENFFVKINEEK